MRPTRGAPPEHHDRAVARVARDRNDATTIDATRRAYSYRAPLDAPRLATALGVGLAIGATAFYLAKVFLERRPILDEDDVARRADARGAGASRARA